MKKLSVLVAALTSALVLTACGGGDDEPIRVVSGNPVLQMNAAVSETVEGTPFVFPGGVPALGTTASTTVTITSPDTGPDGFSIASGGRTASGTLNYGSCIFTVTESTFDPPILQKGQTITINNCQMTVQLNGRPATGASVSAAIFLRLQDAVSQNVNVPVAVTEDGSIFINNEDTGQNGTLTDTTGG